MIDSFVDIQVIEIDEISEDTRKSLHLGQFHHQEGGRKRRPLTQFSASFPHPVQGVSPAALNALAAARGRPKSTGTGFGARITLNFPSPDMLCFLFLLQSPI